MGTRNRQAEQAALDALRGELGEPDTADQAVWMQRVAAEAGEFVVGVEAATADFGGPDQPKLSFALFTALFAALQQAGLHNEGFEADRG